MFDCFWLSVPVQLIVWKDSSPNDLLCVEWDVKPYTLTHSLLCVVMSSCIIHCCQVGPVTGNAVNAAGRNALVTSLTVCCGFIVCWTPAEILISLMYIGFVVDASAWLEYCNTLLFLNSCITPLIYAAKYREFQQAVKRLVSKLNQQHQVAVIA